MKDYPPMHIPLEHVKRFERYVARMGGKIEEPQPDDVNPRAVWLKELTGTRELVSAMTQPYPDQEVEVRVSDGIRWLMRDAFSPPYLQVRPDPNITLRTTIDTNEVRGSLVSLFHELLPLSDEMPSGFGLVRNADKWYARYSASIASPRDIALTIETYGLVTGESLSLSDAGVRHHASYSTVDHSRRNMLWSVIFNSSNIRQHVLQNPGGAYRSRTGA